MPFDSSEAILEPPLHRMAAYVHGEGGYSVSSLDYIILNAAGRIEHVNRTFLGWSGRGAHEMTGRRLGEYIPLEKQHKPEK